MKTKNPDITMDGQVSIFDLVNIPSDIDTKFSTEDINAVINRLLDAKKRAEDRETAERERKKAEERAARERKKLEEKERHVKEVTCMDLPLDWQNAFDEDERVKETHYDSIPDALIHCLATLGKVDIEFIASVTGYDCKTVILTLKGSIYQNPETWGECIYKGWETADEYLSGNLMRKWKAARKADTYYNGFFRDNIRAIEKVLPPAVATKDIYITLGSPWVPTDIIDEFIEHLFGDRIRRNCRNPEDYDNVYATRHDLLTGSWEIPAKNRYYNNFAVAQTWGTNRLNALQIIEKTLNMKTITVNDEVRSRTNSSGKKTVLNTEETLTAIEKQRKLIKHFQDWVWKDPQRKERLEVIFENNYSCVRRRIFDGSFLEFPTMSDSVKLYPYQKDAVARIILTPNTLLAHDVGSGKTYVMIAAGQELRRMGLSKKNLYVVPNNIVGQWKDIFLTMYPDAKLLCVDPGTFKPQKREKILESIRDEDYDGIIMAYSCFEQIPLSRAFYMEMLRDEKETIENIATMKNKATSSLKKKRENLEKALSELAIAMDDIYDSVYFDELGITRLFVDEAHNFKNVPIQTKITKVLGISSGGSKKCKDMMDKVHMIQKNNGGKGVVFATGTPITNSITDAYIMQQYLQSGELAMLNLQSFDSWVGMFAECKTDFEIDVDTSSYRLATRFSQFHNMPELTSLLSMIADFHQVDMSDGIPKHNGYIDTLVYKTKEFTDYLEKISERADKIRSGDVSRTDDNMLKVTTDGRKAALDLRLVDPNAVFSYSSKVAKCAENVADIYHKTGKDLSTQLIFCDISTPKEGFNIYDELKERLISFGVPGYEIAYIHDADTESKREILFFKMRIGEIRILIGSTFKLGLGVNIQDRLIALHHIDVPWRPADMVQREGRILRQGNKNAEVFIYRYITEGSFDAYSWQLLETKQRFIADLLSGSLSERDGADIEDTVLEYAEVKALAVGNPLVKERVEVWNELSRYMSLQRKTVDSRLRMEKELFELPARIQALKDDIYVQSMDADAYREWKKNTPVPITTKEKEREAQARQDLRERLNNAVKDNEFREHETPMATYRGFDIILPAHMNGIKPYIWLKREGKYHIDMGDTELGNLMRIDNFLESFSDRIDRLKEGLRVLEERENAMKEELARNESYTEQIEMLKEKLNDIDHKLGVNKK